MKIDMIYFGSLLNMYPEFPGFPFSKCHNLHINSPNTDCVLTLNLVLLEY